MRASTVFALALALLIGLAAAAGAKYAGLFDKKVQAAELPPPLQKILVAKLNLFEDMTVTADQVMVRELTADEQEQLLGKWGEMEGQADARTDDGSHMRVARRHILPINRCSEMTLLTRTSRTSRQAT